MSQSSLNPVTRVFAVVGSFMALGAIVVAASQGGASASVADQQSRAAKIESVHAPTAILADRSPTAVFQLAIPFSLSDAAQPGNEPAAVKLAKQTCDLLPTWGAQKERMSAEVSELMGKTISADQLRGWASAASLGFCPAQYAAAQR